MSAIVNLAPAAMSIVRHKRRTQCVRCWRRKKCAAFTVVYTGVSGISIFDDGIRAAARAIDDTAKV